MALMTITQFMTGIKNWVLGKIENITALIPSQASSSNKLADKAFVNSSIATATATFQGTYNVVSDLSLSYNATHAQIQTALATKMSALSITPDNNDYAFVQIPTADATPTQIAKIEKYKYNGTAWAFEYELNNSGFTAAQWAAINSGATLELIGKLSALPTNAELTALLAGKQNVIQDLATIRSGASAGTTAVQPNVLAAALVQTVAEAGVFDLSKHNAVEGQLATYADLDAALTALNALHAQYKYGGMSFKFVRTSDKLYVRANLLADDFSTDVNDWQIIEDTPTEDSKNLVSSGGIWTAIINAVNTVKTWANNLFAKTDGLYPMMTVGESERLQANQDSTDAYFERTSGGEEEIYNGNAQLYGFEGNSVKFCQLVTDTAGSTTVSVPSGHKYYSKIGTTKAIATSNGGNISVTGGQDMMIDLTAIGLDDFTTTEEVEQWLAENMPPMRRYPYAALSVYHVTINGVLSVGRNLLNPQTGTAELIGDYSDVYGNYFAITGTYTAISFTDLNGTTTTPVVDSLGKFRVSGNGTLTVTNPSEDCAVFMWWDGSKTGYVPYSANYGRVDLTHIQGKANGEGSLVSIWPDGVPAIGDVRDMLCIDDNMTVAKVYIGKRAYAAGDESNEDVITDGTSTWYVLTTPITYTDLVYNGSFYFADNTPVVLPVAYVVDNWGMEYVTYDSMTAKPIITARYATDAVERIKTLEDTVVYIEETKVNLKGEAPYLVAGLAKNLEGNTSEPAEYKLRQVPAEASSGLAQLTEIRGKSLVWNQLYKNNYVYYYANGTGSVTNSSGLITMTPSSTDTSRLSSGSQPKPISGRRYYIAMCVYVTSQRASTSFRYKWLADSNRSKTIACNKWVLIKANEIAYTDSFIFGLEGGSFDLGDKMQIKEIMMIDLTTMYGAGNEPTTAEFINNYPLYYNFNAGTIINNTTTSIETVGRNQYNPANGKANVIGGMEYYIGGTYTSVTQDGDAVTVTNHLFTPAHTGEVEVAGGNTYDTIINISDANFNGQYEPYEKNTMQLNLPTLTGKLDGEGESIVVCPDGLAAIGSDFDKGIVEEGYLTKIDKTIDVAVPDLGAYDYSKQGNVYIPTTAGAYAPQLTSKMFTAKSKPVIWNQRFIVQGTSQTINGLTFTNKGNGVVEINGKALATKNAYFLNGFLLINGLPSGHKIIWKKRYLSGTRNGGTSVPNFWSASMEYYPTTAGRLMTSPPNSFREVYMDYVKDDVFENFQIQLELYDLTYIFGAGKEPNTAEKFFEYIGTTDYFPYSYRKLGLITTSYESAADFKAAVTGDRLLELGTPKSYVLDTPQYVGYKVTNGGTEMALPKDTASAPQCPFCANVLYGLDAVSMLLNIKRDFIGADSQTSMLTAMKTAGVITDFTQTWNPTTQKYDYTITQ